MLIGASAIADSYLADQYVLPLARDITGGYPQDLVRAVCLIAAYDLITARGHMPEQGVYLALKARKADALAWLAKVKTGEIVPSWIRDQSTAGDARLGGIRIGSKAPRGVRRGMC